MDKKTRIQKIGQLLEQESWGQQEIMWEGDLQSMPVYKIRLDYLVYNKYNGRILSRTESIEQQFGKDFINVEADEGKQLIADLLWKSKLDRNKKTKHDIEIHGQKEVGIITRDGIIIDGNRRAMILNKINTEGKVTNRDYFKAIILPVTLEENRLEIEKLETSYQMGADEKLSYNPVEKYIKAKKLISQNVSIRDIADWMGESETQVKDYISVMKIMDEYLMYLGYDGMYTLLDGREDQFISLTQWLSKFYGGSSVSAFDGYKDNDVDDLKNIAFDYIRVKYEGKGFRNLAHGRKENHFFGNKDIWESFCDLHFSTISPIYDSEEKINLKSQNLTATLNDRDELFIESSYDFLEENLVEHRQKLYNQKYKNEPSKLLIKSIDAMNIAKDNKNINSPEVMEKVAQLNDITTGIIKENNPYGLLQQTLDNLMSIELTNSKCNKTLVLDCLKEIQKRSTQLHEIVESNK